MTQVPMDEARLKALFKTALVEVLEERKDLLRDAIEETLEDIALARAIEDGRRTEEVSRGEVLSLLEADIESSLQCKLCQGPSSPEGQGPLRTNQGTDCQR